jgi:hypothetical protein
MNRLIERMYSPCGRAGGQTRRRGKAMLTMTASVVRISAARVMKSYEDYIIEKQLGAVLDQKNMSSRMINTTIAASITR